MEAIFHRKYYMNTVLVKFPPGWPVVAHNSPGFTYLRKNQAGLMFQKYISELE